MSKEARTELPVRSFASEAAFEKWLQTNHTQSPGLWLRFFKKSATRKALAHKGALDVALCYGWIDGQLKKFDDSSYLHKFTPRGARSVWSRLNRKHVERLTKESRMRPAGLAAVAAAKKDGRWDKAYNSPSNMKIPMDFLKALAKDKQAKHFSIRSIGRIATRSRGDCKRRRSPRVGKREWRRLSQCSGKKRSSTNAAEIRTEHPKLYRYISCHIEIVRK